MPRLEFSGHESTLHKAIVVAFDLGGFSAFCNQPDPLVAAAVPQLDKRMFDLLNETLDIGEESFLLPVILTEEKATNPNFTKFTGDGALLFWLRSMKEDFPQPFCNWLVESMRRFQRELSTQLPVWEKEWRVHKVPRQVRVGITTGVV